VIEGIEIRRYTPFRARNAVGYALEYGYSWIRILLLSLRVAAGKGFDVIHVGNPPDIFWLLALIYRPFGVKFIYDQHDLAPEVFLSRFEHGAKLLHTILLWLERRSYRTADVVISSNGSYWKKAVERGGVSPDRAFIVMNFPDVDRLAAVVPDDSLRGDAAYVVCSIGEFNPQDGGENLVLAGRKLIGELGRRDVLFVVIGSGDDLPRVERMVEEMGLAENFVFTGWLDQQQAWRYVAACDICVLPDPKNPLNDVSTSCTVMEYMALGKPIVAFDLAETRSLAESAAVYAEGNDAGELAEKIETLIDDADARARMGELGRRKVLDVMNWETSRRELLRAYDVLFTPPAS